MEIHEYQAKAILADYGVAIPEGGLAYSPEQATYRASEIGGERWVVKAQVHCGARGQAGGIKICSHEREIWEAADAGIEYCVCITEGIPVQDMIMVKRYQHASRMCLIGPNCAGVISPGRAMMGIMPPHIYERGPVGIVSRSGTLGYEAASQLKAVGIGVSTSVGIGGDPINGSSFLDHLKRFEADGETEAIVMIGEIGGLQEAQAAQYARDHVHKPVVGYIAGLTAPKGRTMGHAGAIVSTVGESAAEKVQLMRECGVTMVKLPSDFGTTVPKVLRR